MLNRKRSGNRDENTSFQVTLYNLNYNVAAKVMIENKNVAIAPNYVVIEVTIDGLNASKTTIEKAKHRAKRVTHCPLSAVKPTTGIPLRQTSHIILSGNRSEPLQEAGIS